MAFNPERRERQARKRRKRATRSIYSGGEWITLKVGHEHYRRLFFGHALKSVADSESNTKQSKEIPRQIELVINPAPAINKMVQTDRRAA